MSIDKLDPFGESGALDTDTVYDSYKNNGKIDQGLRYKAFNKIHNVTHHKINDVIDQTSKGTVDSVGAEAFHKRLFGRDDAMHLPSCPANLIDISDNVKSWVAIDTTVIDGDKKILLCDYVSGGTLDIIDIATGALDQELALSAGYPTSIDNYWPVSVCNDGVYAYILCNLDSTPNELHLQKWRMSDWTPIWATAAAMTATGTLTAGNITSGQIPKVIIADATRVAVLNSMVGISSDADASVEIVNVATGSVEGVGSGGVTDVSGNGNPVGITSDGTNVWFANRNTTGNTVELVSMAIDSPGGTGERVSVTVNDADDYQGSLFSAGDNIVIGGIDSTLVANCYRYDGSTVALIASATSTDFSICSVFYDGLYFWSLGQDTTLTDNGKILKHRYIDACATVTDGSAWDTYHANPRLDTNFVPVIKNLSIFDGRDLWYVVDPTSGNTNAGKLARFARLAQR